MTPEGWLLAGMSSLSIALAIAIVGAVVIDVVREFRNKP